MKPIKIPLILLLLCAISNNSFAEKIKTKKGIEISRGYRSKLIKENKKIRIAFIDSSKTAVKGRYSIVNDSTISIKDSHYFVSSISSIQHQRIGNIFAGIGLVYYGGIVTALGIDLLDDSYPEYRNRPQQGDELEFYVSVAVTVVGVLAVTQGVIYLINGRKYKLEGKWAAVVVNN